MSSIGMLIQDAVFASDHISFFMDLDAASYLSHETNVMPAKQLHQLELENPRIADEYRQQLDHLFTGYNAYRQVKIIIEQSKTKQGTGHSKMKVVTTIYTAILHGLC
jgi:hypothetical protein